MRWDLAKQVVKLEEEVAALRQELAGETENLQSAQERVQDLEQETESHKKGQLTALQEVSLLLHADGNVSQALL